MKKFYFTLLALMACTLTHAATQIQVGDLWFELGKTYATVIADMSGSKTNYATLTEAVIPSSVKYDNYDYVVTTIGTSAFENSPVLQSVTIPSSVTTINTDAFYGCSKLNTLNLPEGLLTIGQRAFYNCNLKDITIPSTVTSIGNAAFKGNPTTSVTWLPVTCSVGTDDSAPFYSTSSQITSFTFGESVEEIPGYLCKYMSKLDTVVLPPSVHLLGDAAFMYCTSLKSINLPKTQKNLPASFFEGCTALESIELPSTLINIRSDAFYGCTKLSNIHLHEGIETIGQRAFWGCNLKDITIPSTVTTIGNAAFKGNPTTSVTWLPATCSIGTDDSAPFYSTSSQITSFTFGDSVKTIPAYLCKNMSKLEAVAIPASVTNIYRNAFMYCTALKSFEFPQGLVTVATSVLEGCTGLKKVVIPESVTTINQDAFYGCSGLQEIYNYAITPQSIDARSLYNVDKSTCTLYVPIDYIDLYKAANVWKEFLNIIGVATGLHFEDLDVAVTYLKQDSSLYFMEQQTWSVPVAPRIQGFTFLKWQVLAGDLANGIVLQAVYEKDQPTDNEEPTANSQSPKAHKLIRQGNVYILRDDELFTITGTKVK